MNNRILIKEIKKLLHQVESLKFCYIYIKKKPENISRSTIYLFTINKTDNCISTLIDTVTNPYAKLKFEEESIHDLQFLMECNLKFKDISELDRVLNLIRELNWNTVHFKYTRKE